jgi:hypothetical protein
VTYSVVVINFGGSHFSRSAVTACSYVLWFDLQMQTQHECGIDSAIVAGFPPRRPGFEPRSGHAGFVVDKVALRQVFSEYFGLLCQFSFHRLLHTHHLSSGAGTIGQVVADVPSGLSLTPPKKLHECGTCMTVLRHILAMLCEMFSISPILAYG